jgi:hypothetical protein
MLASCVLAPSLSLQIPPLLSQACCAAPSLHVRPNSPASPSSRPVRCPSTQSAASSLLGRMARCATYGLRVSGTPHISGGRKTATSFHRPPSVRPKVRGQTSGYHFNSFFSGNQGVDFPRKWLCGHASYEVKMAFTFHRK